MPWDPVINSEILAIHAALLSTNEVLYFGGDEHSRVQHEANQIDHTRLFNVATGAVSRPPTPSSPTTDVFCSGHAQLADGRVIIAGGTETFPLSADHFHTGHFAGHRASWVYRPRSRSWRRIADMRPQPGFEATNQGGGRWYPTLLTVANGEILAMGGHPGSTDRRPNHNNDTPERFAPGANAWTTLTAATVDCPNYPRLHLLRDGLVFIGSPVGGRLRIYDPMTGLFVGPGVPPAGDPIYNSYGATSVLLPLLPGDGYTPRVLVAGGVQPRRINLGTSSPAWEDAGVRQGAAAGRVRRNLCGVLLPTGEVFLSGGITPDSSGNTPDSNAVKTGEIYSPGINWATGAYSAPSAQRWVSTDAAAVARNYHSVALLLPNGRVWTAGSSKNSAEGLPSAVGELRIEVWRPPYDALSGRPQIDEAPSNVAHGERFEVRTPQAASIRRVALIRAGSVTHAFDSDQRYVALQFTHPGGDRLSVTAPPHGAVAPPGTYMLWIVDSTGRPCQLASFVRLAGQRSFIITDRSAFSIHEVEALLPPTSPGPASFPRSLYVVFEGFLPSEQAAPPTLRFTMDSSTGAAAAGMSASYRAMLLEDPSADPDQVQRITFVFDVRFANTSAFSGFTERRTVNVRATSGSHVADATLTLMRQPNPYMIDGPVSWLSTDVRVFQIRPGGARAGVTHGAGGAAPSTFISRLLTEFNAAPNDEYHPFLDISQDLTASQLELSRSVNGQRVYNYAVAKVRYRAAVVPANNVKVFFRLFTTLGTAIQYTTATTYRRAGTGAASVPLLGVLGGALASIPFFAAPRVDTGVVPMSIQTDPPNRRMLSPAGAAESVAYFGAWLDFNQTEARFPERPVGDGPYTGRRSIQELMRGHHQCLVAEVFFEPDPIPVGATPASSENLSQRNLGLVQSDNPGDPATHTVQHTFEVKPSLVGVEGRIARAAYGMVPLRIATVSAVEEEFGDDAGRGGEEGAIDGRGDVIPAAIEAIADIPRGDGDVAIDRVIHDDPASPLAATRDVEDYGPDELLIQWNDLPRETRATLYMPDVDIDEVMRMASARLGPAVLEKVDDHTIRCVVGDVTFVPLPSGRETTIPGLMTLELPTSVRYGEVYTVSVHQVSGVTRGIVGAFQLTIPIRKAELMLRDEIRKLAVLRHIALAIPPGDRWSPVFVRYLAQIAARVRGLGGDPSRVKPSPDGGERGDFEPCPEGGIGLRGAIELIVRTIGACWRGLPRGRCARCGRPRRSCGC
jgi:hypothetical protein